MNDMNDTNTDDGGGTLAIREAATEVVTMAKAAGPVPIVLVLPILMWVLGASTWWLIREIACDFSCSFNTIKR